MREFTVPATVTVPDDARLTDMVVENAREAPDLVSFSRRTASGWEDVTAAAFAARGRRRRPRPDRRRGPGRRPGRDHGRAPATSGRCSTTRSGPPAAVTVPIYETSSAEQVQWIVGDSGAVAVVVETAEHLAVLDGVRAGPARPAARVDDRGRRGRHARRAGRDVPDEEVEAAPHRGRADDLATLIYTSGTTGRPKGCELTHRNLLFEAMTTADGLRKMFRADGSTLLFLPLAHVFGRMVEVGGVIEPGPARPHRGRQEPAGRLRRLPADLHAVGAPGLREGLQRRQAEGARRRQGQDLRRSPTGPRSRTARRWTRGRVPLALRLQHALFDRLVYRKLRAALGGQCRSRDLRRRAARRPARALLPRHRPRPSTRGTG